MVLSLKSSSSIDNLIFELEIQIVMKRVKHLIGRIGRAYLNGMVEMYRPALEHNVPIIF